ncbi:MAG: type III secretion protein [Desulfovibrio sp.]|jgi:type III secretion protein X|nr:type III secretion protein [Desulfovibrio desulfuricans]MBO6170717.1 type III secretion protein [Desulfovibrio sp.]
MANSIRLLDSNLGIQGVLDAQDMPRMPEARPLPSTALREAGLEELFGAATTDKFLEQALCPSVGDGSILQPAEFSAALRESLAALKDNRRPEVRSFVSAELAPLLENEALLQAYSGLLVGG